MADLPHPQDRAYRFFVILALVLAVVTAGFMGYDYFAGKQPGELAYQAGNTYFKDRRFDEAKRSYLEALEADPNLAAAYGGLANTAIEMKAFDEALAAIGKALELQPEFGGYVATRGIIHDHMGHYDKAIADYETALVLMPQVAEGMGWIDRFFYKLASPPPTVADRLAYLKAQMKLPPEARVLRVPQIDDQQKPYEQ